MLDDHHTTRMTDQNIIGRDDDYDEYSLTMWVTRPECPKGKKGEVKKSQVCNSGWENGILRDKRWKIANCSVNKFRICRQSVCWLRVWLQTVGGPLAGAPRKRMLAQKGRRVPPDFLHPSPPPPKCWSVHLSIWCIVSPETLSGSHSVGFSLHPYQISSTKSNLNLVSKY